MQYSNYQSSATPVELCEILNDIDYRDDIEESFADKVYKVETAILDGTSEDKELTREDCMDLIRDKLTTDDIVDFFHYFCGKRSIMEKLNASECFKNQLMAYCFA